MITREDLRQYSSIFSNNPSPKMSDKYTMLNSMNVINKLEEYGYYPSKINESKVRKSENQGYQAHTIRFRHENFKNLSLYDNCPELVYINSHNGRISAKMFAGIFRMVCSNGQVIADSELGGIVHKHMGLDSEGLEEVIYNFAKQTDKILTHVDDYKKIKLNETEKKDFATIAKNEIYGKKSKINPIQLVTPRRETDFYEDLFTVYNVVQENVTKGGIEYKTDKKRVKTKEIKSPQRDLDINVFLWGLMDQFAKLK